MAGEFTHNESGRVVAILNDSVSQLRTLAALDVEAMIAGMHAHNAHSSTDAPEEAESNADGDVAMVLRELSAQEDRYNALMAQREAMRALPDKAKWKVRRRPFLPTPPRLVRLGPQMSEFVLIFKM